MKRIAAGISGFFAAPDEVLIDAGAGGERLAAHIRLALFMCLLLIPIVSFSIIDEVPPELWIGSVGAVGGFLVAALFVWLAHRDRRFPGVAFITSGFDITLVSIVLAAFALAGRPQVAINSMLLWPLYMMFILATCIRFDPRVCLSAGVLAIVQYAALFFWVTATWDVTAPEYADPLYGDTVYGGINMTVQIGRGFLLVAATGLALGIVVRIRNSIQASGTDVLTGLWNRRYIDQRLSAEVARAARQSSPLTVVFLDLDHFKSFNDRWGHGVGDRVLKIVARLLVDESREEDVVARWGGEEFVVLLPDTSGAGAAEHLRRVRLKLAATPLPTGDHAARITLSGGIAEFPADAASPAALIAAADRRLLAAKAAGRDRMVGEG